MKFQGILVSLLLVFAAPVFAQNTLAPVTDFGKKGAPVSADCQQEMSVFVKLASVYPHPKSGWKFYIVCDESTWKEFMQQSFFSTDGMEHYGETDIDKGVTMIRGWKLIHPDLGVTPDHIVAHELAHIMLHSRDERKVDAQAYMWIQQQERRPGSLVAATHVNANTH